MGVSFFQICLAVFIFTISHSVSSSYAESVDALGIPKSLDFENYLPHEPEVKNGVGRKLFDDDNRLLGESDPFADTVVKRRLFNTSVVLTVPMFSFLLPTRATPGSQASVDLANQAIFGLFSLLIVVIVFTVPIIFTGTQHARSNEGSSFLDMLNSRSNKVFNLMGADLTNQIGLDREKCLQKTICEAHRNPDRYGLFGLPFRIFFPPPVEGTPVGRSSPYQLAAADGENPRKDCKLSYKCFFDILDLFNYCLDVLNYANEQDEP